VAASEDDARTVGGSYLCDGYELRITQRCLIEDLGYQADTGFAEAVAHEIVVAFRNQRKQATIGTKTVGPEAGPDTIYRLGYGDHHRGATWHDQDLGAVWLCAYGYHESGEPDDAFPYFRELMHRGDMLPTDADRDAVRAARAERLADALPTEAQRLLAEARADPGAEISGTLATTDVSIVVVVVETLQETHVAIVGARSRTEILMILAAFFPEAEFGEWSSELELPTRQLNWEALESCWYILHGVA
jgi:hypothetical protein